MYYVQKTIEISAAHNLMLSYESKCENLHGHNWIIVVYCKSETLDQDGMVIDFTHIKKIVKDTFDHKYQRSAGRQSFGGEYSPLDLRPCKELLQGLRPGIRRQYRYL